MTQKRRAGGESRPVEAIACDDQVDQTNLVQRWAAERSSVTLIEGFRDIAQLYGKCQGIWWKVGARPALPSPGRGGFT